jgi:hypothetical protein
MNSFKIKSLVALAIVLVFASCEEYLDKPFPVDLIDDSIVIEDSVSAEQVVLGAYSSLQVANAYGNLAITSPGILSDELIHTGSFPTVKQMDQNQVIADNVTTRGLWTTGYRGIFIANTLLERIGPIQMSQSKRDQLIGEAKFLRAFYHFNLMNYFGGIPIATTTSLASLSVIDRASEEDVQNFLIQELTEAATLLDNVDYGAAGQGEEDRNRAGEYTVKALLARVHLYAGEKATAASFANDVIANGPYSLETNYVDVFSGSSNEVIFQIFSSANDQNGLAFQFLSSGDGGRYEYAPGPEMVAAFESGDDRVAMIEDLGSGKFQVVKYVDPGTGTDQPIVFRLAEMYLIRAEGTPTGPAVDADVNTLRTRSGLANKTGVLLDDIIEERFVELAFEGHRWYDLIRTNKVDAVMSVINPTSWSSTDVLLPIPQYEIQQNPTLAGKQNPGY